MKNLLIITLFTITTLIASNKTLSAEEIEVALKSDSTQTLYDFESSKETGRWISINDNVMGGISEGYVSHNDDSSMEFSGSLSLENNGGFASIRTLMDSHDISGYEGIRIRVKGDGRTFQFRIRVDRRFDSYSFRYEFKTLDKTWIELDLPFESFIPTYRGRTLRNVTHLDPSEIQQLGFMLADKKTGPFKLYIDSIKAYK